MSERVLQQSEIDELIRSVKDGTIPTSKDSLVPLQNASPLDVRDPAWTQQRVIRRRLPFLDLVFDRLAPAIQITLTKSLRFPIRCDSVTLDLVKFVDFRKSLEGRGHLFQVMRLDPLRGLSLMLFDPAILYALLDALMGGLGVAESPSDREVSDIEESLLRRVHAEILRDFESAWKPWFPLRVEHVRSDRAARIASTISEDEICHVGCITIAGDALPASPIYFVMPYSSLEPLFDAASMSGGEEIDPSWRLNLVQNVRSVEAEVRAVLGETEVTAKQARALREGDVIKLDRLASEEIDLLVEGRPVFRGRLGQSNQCYAVKVTERRESETPLQDRTAGQALVRRGPISREQLAVALVDEKINRRQLLESIVSRGWVERGVLETALRG